MNTPAGSLDEFIAATEALSAHNATYEAVQTAALRRIDGHNLDGYHEDIDLFFVKQEALVARQRKAAGVIAEATGKTVDETIIGCLAGMILADLKGRGS